jgi:VWFA-related protein
VSLVIFSEAGTKIQNGSSRDGNALAALYDQYRTGLRSGNLTNGGYWGETERIDISLKALASIVTYEKTRPGRKLMIWFSRGWPMLSATRTRLTSNDAQQLFNSIVAVSTDLRQARITLYSVDPFGAENSSELRNTYYEEFLKGVTSPSRALPGNLGLQVLAVQSGGRVFTTSNDLTAVIAKCAADADAFYVLSFNTRPANQANEYHSLGVMVDKPGMTARTHTGYYAQP